MSSLVSVQNTAFSLLKTGGVAFHQLGRKKEESSGQTDPLLAALEELDPDKANDLKKKLEGAQSLLQQLESSKTDMSEQRRAAAAQKVAQIKEKLKALHLLAAVNPEAAARQAAQLSRELSQATKEYASASGGANTADLQSGVSGMNVVAAVQAEGTVEAGSVASPEAAVAGEGDNTEVVEIAAANGLVLPEDESSEKTAELEAAGRQVQGDPELIRQSLEDIKKQKEEDKEAFREQLQAHVAKINEAAGLVRADQEFANDVKALKAALKSIIESAKKKLAEKEGSAAEQDIKSAENALREVDRSLGDITSGGIGGAVDVINVLI